MLTYLWNEFHRSGLPVCLNIAFVIISAPTEFCSSPPPDPSESLDILCGLLWRITEGGEFAFRGKEQENPIN